MEVKKTGIINVAASLGAFLTVVFVSVVYVLIMIGDKPDSLAFEITSDYAVYWVYRFVLVILMYLCCAAALISIPAYFILKTRGSSSPARKFFGGLQIICMFVMILLVLLFWSTFSGVFNGDFAHPLGTPYRILEIIFVSVSAILVILTSAYAPSTDMLKKLKKKHNKI